MEILHWTTADWFDFFAKVISIASALRLALHWFKGLLMQWINEDSQFWDFYSKLENSVSYISMSLAAFGRKASYSTPSEPVTRGESPSEGKII